jgi:hypothetical protein
MRFAAIITLFVSVIILVSLAACEGGHVTRQDGSSSFVQRNETQAVNPSRSAQQNISPPAAPPAATGVIAQGAFSPDAHAGSGYAVYVNNGTVTKLHLVNFQAEHGIGMRIYLATDKSATRFVDLGDVQGYKGNYEYIIPPGTDLAKYPYVLVWSRGSEKSFLTARMQ